MKKRLVLLFLSVCSIVGAGDSQEVEHPLKRFVVHGLDSLSSVDYEQLIRKGVGQEKSFQQCFDELEDLKNIYDIKVLGLDRQTCSFIASLDLQNKRVWDDSFLHVVRAFLAHQVYILKTYHSLEKKIIGSKESVPLPAAVSSSLTYWHRWASKCISASDACWARANGWCVTPMQDQHRGYPMEPALRWLHFNHEEALSSLPVGADMYTKNLAVFTVFLARYLQLNYKGSGADAVRDLLRDFDDQFVLVPVKKDTDEVTKERLKYLAWDIDGELCIPAPLFGFNNGGTAQTIPFAAYDPRSFLSVVLGGGEYLTYRALLDFVFSLEKRPLGDVSSPCLVPFEDDEGQRNVGVLLQEIHIQEAPTTCENREAECINQLRILCCESHEFRAQNGLFIRTFYEDFYLHDGMLFSKIFCVTGRVGKEVPPVPYMQKIMNILSPSFLLNGAYWNFLPSGEEDFD